VIFQKLPTAESLGTVLLAKLERENSACSMDASIAAIVREALAFTPVAESGGKVERARNDLSALDDPDWQEKFSAAIMGAMAFGAENVKQPPAGHWLAQWWDLGRLHAARAAAPAPVAGSAEPVATVVATAPERIWLQVCVDCDGSDCAQGSFPSDHEGITWCQDSIGGVQVEYVRADTHPATIREVSDEDVECAQEAFVKVYDWVTPTNCVIRKTIESFRARLNAELRGERKEGE
jgi:hypothetical protein